MSGKATAISHLIVKYDFKNKALLIFSLFFALLLS